jgi:hypothetical protein
MRRCFNARLHPRLAAISMQKSDDDRRVDHSASFAPNEASCARDSASIKEAHVTRSAPAFLAMDPTSFHAAPRTRRRSHAIASNEAFESGLMSCGATSKC